GRADIYALGVVLYKCVVGAPPFFATSLPAWITAHMERPMPRLPDLGPGTDAMEELLERMLAKRREDRPQEMAEVISGLEAVYAAAGEPLPAAKPRITTRAAAVNLPYIGAPRNVGSAPAGSAGLVVEEGAPSAPRRDPTPVRRATPPA